MAIDWIYDTTYVSFGVEWNAAYASGGRVTIAPRVYRWDRYNTIDGTQFWETLYYEPSGATGGPWSYGWGSGSGTREVDSFQTRYYPRRASAYTVQIEIETADGFGTAYDGYFHTIGEVTRTATYYVPALPPAFNTLTASRVSDNQVNLSWTAGSGNIKAVCIERSVDGGSYSEVAVILNPAATSWQDNATSADHSYTYRARYHHEGAYGAYSNTVTVTMTPAAPQTISTAAAGGINIDVTLTNPSPVATKVQYEVSTDDGSTWGATQESASLTSFSVSASGTVKIRARNVYDGAVPALVSDWLTSDTIVTICPPAAPTLISPVGVLNLAAGSDVTFSWQHNPIDGSAQTAYELRYATNGGAWTTLSGTTAQSRTVALSTFSAGDSVTWQVRTKGADPSYSDWSQTSAFNVYTAPTLSITSPGATITGMPISMTATYSDMAGFTCQAATVSLTQNGRTLFSEPATISGTSITSSLDVSEFLPTNGETYTVVLTARSSSSLQTTANATFTVDFVEPQAGDLNISNDPDTGYVSLLATFDNSASEITYTGSTNEQFESTEGYVRSLTVEGKSEKWNQLFPSNSSARTDSGITMTNSGGGKYTFTGTSTTNGAMLGTGIDAPIGHKFYFFGNSGGVKMSSQGRTDADGRGNFWTNDTTSTRRYFVFYIANGTTANTTFTPSVIDLTAIYGAGNEPTSLDDPRIAWLKAYALAHPAYDAGSLVSIEGVSVGDGTITTTLRSAGSVHDTLMADEDSYTVRRNVGVRSYQSGDESDPEVLTDGTNTYYALATTTTDPETSMSRIEIGSAFTVATDLDSTFEMTTWDGSADAVSISVSRVNADGTITPLLTDGASGSGLVDRYAPLNTPYQYAVTTTADTQAVKTVYVDNELVTDLWFVYWGDNIASAKWNPDNGGIQVTRPQKTRVYYAGRRDPVSYDGHAVSLTETPSWMFLGKDEVDTFVQLIEDGGRGIYKSCDGWVYHADFDLTMTPSYTAIGYYGGASLGITRIAGERL